MYTTAQQSVPAPLESSIRDNSLWSATYACLIIAQWEALKSKTLPIVIDGATLNLAKVALVAKRQSSAILTNDHDVRKRIDRSVKVLNDELENGRTIYGVNTGYGGSADVRCGPTEMRMLQQAFLQHLNSGILPFDMPTNTNENAHSPSLKQQWVRAAMVIRANSVARGHSAVRSSTIAALLELLNRDIIPVIPTRGSISASGDLAPLSYVAGMLEGNQAINCWIGPPDDRHSIPASEALASANIAPVIFEPKEALGLVNGTAISAAAASLTLSTMHNIVALSLLLTAMNVEALLGTTASFAPFISEVRPHPGQAQVAFTIFSALQGSKLASGSIESHSHSLFQDRYSLRTVPQWLGPFLEDLLLANEQLTVEINSTTDNPLIDPIARDVYHGGNFQAVSVTSAMEKCRSAAQAVGRMLFSQFTELVNPATNRALPPNLCADEPSTSFTMKGVDVNMASYMSELSFLANPVHNHVVCAEMGNQALNSLALISARYADSSLHILSMMCACTLYGVCQALDLRAMNRIFEEKLEGLLGESITHVILSAGISDDQLAEVRQKVWEHVKTGLAGTTTLDSKDRFKKVMTDAKVPLLEYMEGANEKGDYIISKTREWAEEIAITALRVYNETREEYLISGDASGLLGRASKRLYHFIRRDLKVPLHRGVVDHPTYETTQPRGKILNQNGISEVGDTWRKKTIGQWISTIHEAIEDDRIIGVMVECLREGLEETEQKVESQMTKSNGLLR